MSEEEIESRRNKVEETPHDIFSDFDQDPKKKQADKDDQDAMASLDENGWGEDDIDIKI